MFQFQSYIYLCFTIQSPVIKIQQTVGSVTIHAYATCIGDNGPLDDDIVMIGAQFARINNLSTEEITMFEISKEAVGSIISAVAEPSSEEDWEMLVRSRLNYNKYTSSKFLKSTHTCFV